MNILAFSKFLGYEMGGAETSTRRLLEERYVDFGDQITLVSQRGARFLGVSVAKAELSSAWNSLFVDFGLQLPRFSSVEYVLNRKQIMGWFSKVQADELWTYGSLAPAAMLGFDGSIRYFVRSETDLGIVGNYYKGAKRLAKALYAAAELPATKVHRRDLNLAILKAKVVANSKYMAARTHELLGVEAEVLYPSVNVTQMRLNLENDNFERKWIVFVGDSPVKGINHVLKASKYLPELNFRIVSRFVQQPRLVGNVLWTPWETEAWRVYRGACLVIVPSQWKEAYGRIAREAFLLGLPVLVSAVGGLPEAVDGDKNCMVEDYRSTDSWIAAIKNAVNIKQI